MISLCRIICLPKKIFLSLWMLFFLANLSATLRIDVLMLESSELPHLPARDLYQNLREYPQSVSVYGGQEKHFENEPELRHVPWSVLESHCWIVPSFHQKTYLSLVQKSRVRYPSFKPKNGLSSFFLELQPLYLSPSPLFWRENLIGHAEIYSANQQRVKMNLCLQTTQGPVQLQETLPYQQWVIVDNPYLTALIHLEKLP